VTIAGTFYPSGMPRTTSERPQRRVLEATVAAALFGAAPSLLYSLQRDGVRGAWRYGLRATRAIGTLVPSGRPNVLLGAATHLGVSVVVGQALGRLLPRRGSALWGAAAGAALGCIGVGLVGRRFGAIRDLPFGPQVADNIAFGVVFALVADRAVRPPLVARQTTGQASAMSAQGADATVRKRAGARRPREIGGW
jgi:hypothetical protein